MKKLLSLILCFILCLSLFACNTSGSKTTKESNLTQQPESSSSGTSQKTPEDDKLEKLSALIEKKPLNSVTVAGGVKYTTKKYDLTYNAESIQKVINYLEGLNLKETYTPTQDLVWTYFVLSYQDGTEIFLYYYDNKISIPSHGWYEITYTDKMNMDDFLASLEEPIKYNPYDDYLESFDSVNIYPKEKLDVSDDLESDVVKLYFCNPNLYFASTHSILYTISQTNKIAYMVSNGDNELSYITLLPDKFDDDEVYSNYKVYDLKQEGYDHFKYALHPELVFDEAVEVYYSYALIQHFSYYSTSFWIYFSTNIGDYILYDGYINKAENDSYGKYLFPLKDFFAIADDMYSYGIESGEMARVTVHDVRSLEELAPYLFEEQ